MQFVHQPFDFSTLRQQQVQASGVRAQPLQAAGQAVHAVQTAHQNIDFSTLRQQQVQQGRCLCPTSPCEG